jgi:mono/diheme cytochrome c family protein
VTEIPEHLLKRSQQRRAAMGLGGDGGGDAGADKPAGDAAEPSTAVAKAAAAEPAAPAGRAPREEPKPEPAAKPDPPYVAAAKRRRRVPYFAMPVLALLPLWGMFYWFAVQPPPADQNDPLVVGAQVYAANCAGCHGGAGEGGSGPKLAGGEVLKTFKNPLDQARWVEFGSAGGGADANGNYGDKNRPGGQHNIEDKAGNMPTFKGNLTDDQIAAVVRHERETLSGEKTPPVDQQITAEQIVKYLQDHPATS